MMAAIMKPAHVSPAFIKPSPGRHKPQAPSPQPSERKIVRLKLTKPRNPRPNPQEVDWDEDLRPTPSVILEAKGTIASKRVMVSKTQKASAKRRKSNMQKSSAKEDNTKMPQLPLMTLNASTMPAAPPNKDDPSKHGPSDGQSRELAVKINENGAEDSDKLASPINDGNGNGNKSGKRAAVLVEIRSCTSVTSDSTSDLEDYGKGSYRTSRVNILEHRAQSNNQARKNKAAHVIQNKSSSSDVDLGGPSHPTTSKVTILESRALPDGPNSKNKAAHEARSPKHHGRAKSVGSKLMLALHGAANPSQQKPVKMETKPLIISSDIVLPHVSPEKEQSDQMSSKTAPVHPQIECVSHSALPVEASHPQAPLQTVNPALIERTHPRNTERISTHGKNFWESIDQTKVSPRQGSSEIEIGRGLMDDDPSILDYHMEMEHISGFAALQPMRLGPNTSPRVTNICDSQVNSSESSKVARLEDPTTVQIRGRGFSQTPDSQKPLLTNEALTQLNSQSSQPPKSVPKTSIVDSNGSPRLRPQSVNRMEATHLELNGDQLNQNPTSDTTSSPSEYDGSSSDVSMTSRYRGLNRTKFQTDMFLEYGIDTQRLQRSRWPPHPRHRPSFFQENTVGGAHSKKVSSIESSSSQAREGLHHSSTTGNHDSMEWISTLQVAQKDADSLLRETNSHLSTQLAAEKATISRVLGIYREGCGRILDDLSQAQEARMQLYHRQMQDVKEQHADICHELIRGLQELERRVQQGHM